MHFCGGGRNQGFVLGGRCGGSSPKIRGGECGSQAWPAELTAADVMFICRLQRLSGPANVKWRSPHGVRTIFPSLYILSNQRVERFLRIVMAHLPHALCFTESDTFAQLHEFGT